MNVQKVTVPGGGRALLIDGKLYRCYYVLVDQVGIEVEYERKASMNFWGSVRKGANCRKILDKFGPTFAKVKAEFEKAYPDFF